MSLRFYMDVHVRWAITAGLRRRGVDVLTAQEDGAARFDDSDLLDRATQLDRVLVSQDDDLLREAARRQANGEHFAGVVYSQQLRITVGQAIRDLELPVFAQPAPFAERERHEGAPVVQRFHYDAELDRMFITGYPDEYEGSRGASEAALARYDNFIDRIGASWSA